MPAASRHAKPKTPAVRFGAPIAAAVAIAGLAVAFVFVQGGSAAARPPRHAIAATSTGSVLTDDRMTTAVHRYVAARENRVVRRIKAAARRKHLAALAAARQARQQAAATPTPAPTPAPSSSPAAPPSSGGDAANSPLGVCIRNAEEGGSYAWGPGNGGGAYQFELGTWEHYGGAAGEYGSADAAYQDQIFDNAVAAGGASNWTDYDGC
jgi:hypothetical protein